MAPFIANFDNYFGSKLPNKNTPEFSFLILLPQQEIDLKMTSQATFTL